MKIKPKISRRKELKQIRAEINKIENRKTIEEIHEKLVLWQNEKRINKSLAGLIRKRE